METLMQTLIQSTGLGPEVLAFAGIGLGVLIIVFGMSGALVSNTSPEALRMRTPALGAGRRPRETLIRAQDNDPSGILQALLPRSQHERTKIAKQLRQAGVHGRYAVRNFYLVRTLLSLVLPLLFVAATYLPGYVDLPLKLKAFLTGVTYLQTFYIMTVCIVAGYYGPLLWLNSRMAERRERVRYSFPNALDLLQVSIEAGLGMDAALTRVAHEMARVAPELSAEFTILQLEIQAGKDRERALLDMAERCDVEAVLAFVNVIIQSSHFGTSISEALSAFSNEMRLTRELNAQEQANKLPVKMSAVMAGIMMPVLLMLTITPVLIRWLRMMG
ncbi:type II secretion system F family protein [Pseudogemmobacter sp. W21_MBD1_M6]|uniref:type II secretion system F family protein n=1 Tax=Pseudogemmobacter sp. W21_MBD1_M6 TaxID=3240271 RepID=UPI003F9C978E